MNPIKFPEATTILAKDQPQFRPLPVAIAFENPDDKTSLPRFTCKYDLSDLELQQIIKTKSIFINQFGYGFHPIYPQVDSPFLVLPVQYKSVGNRCYDFFIPMDNGEFIVLNGIQLELAVGLIMEKTGLQADQIHFKEKPSMGIDENGNVVDL